MNYKVFFGALNLKVSMLPTHARSGAYVQVPPKFGTSAFCAESVVQLKIVGTPEQFIEVDSFLDEVLHLYHYVLYGESTQASFEAFCANMSNHDRGRIVSITSDRLSTLVDKGYFVLSKSEPPMEVSKKKE